MMKPLSLVLLSAFATFVSLSPTMGQAADGAPIVRLAEGEIRGASDHSGIVAFKAIPYAAPPVGELRWRPPQAPLAWSGVRDGSGFGPGCPAPATGPLASGATSSEDCLTLNVWTPQPFVSAKRPVMVWIHGGGFQFGSSSAANTDGARLAAKGVVVVSVNYRLGVLGFLAHPDLDAPGAASGNYGLQDQIQALRWVKANIARFGGDPANVTLFGESAGAMSVGMLMSSPLAHGLFAKAIGESGAFWDSENGSIVTREEALARGRALADRLGHGSIEGLRALPGQDIINATQWAPTADPVVSAFSPSIDGHVLPASPAAAFARGHQMKIPLLAGHNGAEDFIFRDRALPHSTAADFKKAAAALFGEEHLSQFLSAYPAGSDPEAAESANALIGDLAISQQSWAWLQAHQRTSASPVYGYEFRYHSAYSPMPIHGAEIDFVFGTLTPQRMAPGAVPGARDTEVSDQMMSYWANFARRGDPNGPGLPAWPAYQAENPRVMEFAAVTAAKPEADTARFRFLERFRTDGRLPQRWRPAR